MPEIEWDGFWVSHNRFVWKPKNLRRERVDPDECWYVACGCDTHGDHLACTKDCRDFRECAHPLRVDVVASKVTLDGAEEDVLKGRTLPGQRPPRQRAPSDLRKEMEALRVDLDKTTGPYRQMENPWSVCFHVAQRIKRILSG